ncbi:oligosaccharide flippase family protein [Qipengyuania sp. 902]|uniref:oligosaccharide flippase family protein n=1 Tax=Qipengyuania sp. 902 TaxID=3417565 RepID=UPI003EBA9563
MAKNTAMLFVRQIFTILINLFTVRILLNQLGVQDFAIYNVILSVVMLGSFFTLSMSTIIQRYFAFAMGKQSQFSLKKVHDAGLLLSIIAAVLSLGLLATAGTWFVRTELVIAAERFEAAQILFYLLSLAFALNIFSTFHSSVILAHKDMHAFAWISILDAILRLGAAVALIFLQEGQLVAYGVLLVGVALVLGLNFFVYCVRKYDECRLATLRFELPLMRDMVAFGGWTMFGQLTTVSRTQACPPSAPMAQI